MAAIIIGSDSTQLSTFTGDITAHPVYLTLGNIPMAIRNKDKHRANIPIALLPQIPVIFHERERKRERFREAKLRLFQASMLLIMEPLMKYSKTYVNWRYNTDLRND